MHSYFSNRTQPYPLASYSIFVAEVASTFNEALLNDYMLKKIKDDATRLSLLGNYLESIKGTVFRQTQFAEFELRMHEMVEQGQPLTGDTLSRLYAEIVKRYYGHDQGVCIVDDYVENEWAMIPHFYNAYYVFQYATSFTASSALSEKILFGRAGDDRAVLGIHFRWPLKVSHRFAEGSGCRHDYRRAIGIDGPEDEPRHGSDGKHVGEKGRAKRISGFTSAD